MPAPPLTHHDIIRIASPLSSRGFNIDMARSNRTDRYVEFKTQSSFSPQIRSIHALHIGTNGKHYLSRVLIHSSGLVSTLGAVVSNLDEAFDTFAQIPEQRQMQNQEGHLIAFSYALEPLRSKNMEGARMVLQFACAQVSGVEIRVDTSTGGAMPADVRVIVNRHEATYLPDTLANGSDLPLLHRAVRVNAQTSVTEKMKTTADPSPSVERLPEDFLAVLGAQWRPLRFQGDHWKGVLRTLGREPARTPRAEQYVVDAVAHTLSSLSEAPEQYHQRQHNARWRVFIRRLQPLMLFVGILAMMPISWLFVSKGGMSIHPLALGLTPLLMVGVVVMTAREIPVMEIPERPKPVPSHYWSPEKSP